MATILPPNLVFDKLYNSTNIAINFHQTFD